MPRHITWLHISDFHFCSPTSGWKSDRILGQLRADLDQLRRDGLRPDLVFVTGDIAFGHVKDKKGLAIADQYAEAAVFFEEVLGAADPPIPAENLFLVPGNHDVHREQILESTTQWLDKLHDDGDVDRVTKMIRESDGQWKEVMRRLDAYRAFLKDLGTAHLLQDPDRLLYAHVRPVAGVRVGVAGLNSAWSCGRAHEKGRLWLAGEWQVNTLEAKLRDADVRIALLHHPPNWFGEREDTFVGRRIEAVFDVSLHGHEHEGWVMESGSHVRIAAGATYGSTDAESGYNLVRIDLDAGTLEIWLRQYSSRGSGGWVPLVIPGKTTNAGVRRLDGLPWLARFKGAPPPAPPPPPPAPAAPASAAPPPAASAPSAAPAPSAASAPSAAPVPPPAASVPAAPASTPAASAAPTPAVPAVLSPAVVPSVVVAVPAPAPVVAARAEGPEVRGVFGRRRVLDELAELIGKKSIVVLYGMPGIGKTTLAVELARKMGLAEGSFLRFAVTTARWTMSDIFGQMARVLGNRDEQPEPPPVRAGKRDWSTLERGPHEVLVLVEQAHLLFEEDHFRDREIAGFFRAVAERAPHVRVLLEGRLKPPENLLGPEGNSWLGARMVQGLDADALARFFEHPFPDRPEIGWALRADQIAPVLARLGGEKHKGAHPLAASLLVSVAHGLDETPLQVLERHASVLRERIEHALFRELYERVLSAGERTVVGLCALYRDEIPGVIHPTALNETAGDDHAFQGLERRCLLAHAQGQYYLHSLVRDLASARLGGAVDGAHATVAGAWLQTVRFTAKRSPDQFQAAAEAAHHFMAAGQYQRLTELAGALPRRNDLLAELESTSLTLHQRREHPLNRAVLEVLVALDPDNHKARRFLGECIEHLEGLGDARAVEQHEAAHRLSPRFPPYLANIGRAYLARGEPARFLAILDGLAPDDRNEAVNDQVRAIQADALARLGRDEEASAIRRGRIDAGTRDPAIFVEEARFLHGKGRSKDALDLLDLAVKRGAHDEYTVNIRGTILEALGRGEEASAIRGGRIDAGTQDPAVFSEEARFLHGKGRSKDALDLLDLAVKRGAHNEYTANIRGTILEALGRGEEASAIRGGRIDAGTRDPAVFNEEARFLHRKGRSKEALDLLDLAVKRGAHDEYTVNIRGTILEVLGRGEEASAIRGGRIDAGTRDPAVFNEEARFLHRKGRSKEALDLLDLAVKRGAHDEYTVNIRGTILEALGR